MKKEEIQQILKALELDYEAEPTLIYVFYKLPDGRIDNFSISVRHGGAMSDDQIERLMRSEYPASRTASMVGVERPEVEVDRRKEWIDTGEVCRWLKISRKTLWLWTKKGLFHPSRTEGRLLYDRYEIEEVIASNIVCENGRLDHRGQSR
ncbi:MAG: helix-turn-helix domain-containing protein [Bacteroidales bacterium]|nr:helix-turn-helix domain-containing protein [Bacteroidales bacterium]